jgi:hypothetical protein
MWHVWGRGEVHTGLWWGNREGDHLEDSGVDGRIILILYNLIIYYNYNIHNIYYI